jgi:hypothetical protein
MLFFRSEEHLDNWLASTGHQRGDAMSLEQTWRLGRAWYVDRRDPAWRARTIEQSQAVLTGVGLTDPFWALGG